MAELDRDQTAAVDAGPVDLFVSAGAGSGKTRVLATRFVNAVLGVAPYAATDPHRLLAITFTEKAAAELNQRIRDTLVARDERDAARRTADGWISTIHAMCSRILRQHAFTAGIDPRFSVLTDVESAPLELAAFEEAARELTADDEAVAALLETFGFANVAGAARAVRAKVRSLALQPHDIATISETETREHLAAIACRFRDIADELRALPGKGANADRAVSIAASLTEALGCGVESCAEAVCALDSRGFSAVGPDEVKQLVGEARELVAEAQSWGAQLAVATHERAFIGLVTAFDCAYDEAKRVRGALDFEDLQVLTARLLAEHPDIARHYRDWFAMVMIDEFQDTNELQVSIAEALSEGDLCTVGDEKQSIYAFRNADVSVFRRRGELSTNHTPLYSNYRTAKPLLDALNGLFAHPALFGGSFAPLVAGATHPPLGDGVPFEVRFLDSSDTGMRVSTAEAEGECIAAAVGDLLADGAAPGDIAVLMRALANDRGDAVERSLRSRGIPVILSAGGSFFSRPEIQDARAFLRVVDNVRDDVALLQVLAGSIGGLSDEGLFIIGQAARQAPGRRAHLWDALTDEALALAPADRVLAGRTIEAVRWARRQRGAGSIASLIIGALERLDMDLVLLAGAGGARAWSNVLRLARFAADYERAAGGDLKRFLEYLTARETHAKAESEARIEGETDAVRVMTIHAAKGLEFPCVVLGGLSRADGGGATIAVERTEGGLLLGMRLPGEDGSARTAASERIAGVRRTRDAEEAKRLLYVGCTRAERRLTIVASTNAGKEAAGRGMPDAIRCALGMGEAESIEPGVHRIGDGEVVVRLETPALPVTTLPERSESEAALPAVHVAGVVAHAQPLAHASVSYSALHDHEQCGYRYYLRNVMQLAPPPATSSSGALAVGTAVHAVLERCDAAGGANPTVCEAVAASAGLAAADVERVRAAADSFLGSETAKRAFAGERVLREAPICMPVGETVLVGSIDLLSWTGSRALIVDYKTGAAPLETSEAEERYRFQGQCYGLAVLAAGAEHVDVVFAEVERGREIVFSYSAADRAALEDVVTAITGRIEAGEFESRETYDAGLCETCPGAGTLCAVSRPKGGGAA